MRIGQTIPEKQTNKCKGKNIINEKILKYMEHVALLANNYVCYVSANC